MSVIERLLESQTVRAWAMRLPTVKQTIFSLVGVALLVYLFVILLSYNPADPAWSHVSSDATVTNIGGALGAWIADVLFSFFGVAAWLSVGCIAHEVLRLWWARTQIVWPLRMAAYGLLIAMGGALMAALVLARSSGHDGAIHIGGIVGDQIAVVLINGFGVAASLAFLVLFVLFIAVMVFDVRWHALVTALLGWIGGERPQTKTAPTALQDDETDEAAAIVREETDYQPHNHEGALESFLVHSGLRDALQQQVDATSAHQQQTAKAVQTDHQPSVAPSASPAFILPKTADHPSHIPTSVPDEQPAHASASLDLPTKSVQPPPVAEKPADSPIEKPLNKPHTPPSTPLQSAKPSGQADAPILSDSAAWTQDNRDHQPTIDVPSPSAPSKSRAMDTLAYRMSLSPLPSLDLLDQPDLAAKPVYTKEALAQESELLEIKLQEYNIKATVVSATVGPVVTRFELQLDAGLRASRVTKVAQDLARSMSKASLRVVEVIPGKPYIGIEVPNAQREMVRLIELLDTPDYRDPDNQIAIAVGKDIGGKPVIADLAKAPHMLVAGTTGSGKSVLVNSFLLSMLLKYTPDELKLVLIDPKQLELANYGDIPHLLTPVITDMKDAVAALTWCVNEMERRYQLMSKLRVRKISEFNKKIEQAQAAGEPLFDPLWRANDSVSQTTPPKLKPLPMIVIVADEFADMIMQLGKTAEEPIVRLAQKARAAGVHLLLATQRPTVNVVTGLIKANIPARVALRVNSKVDSRTIIEEGGAEDMLGHGDMMFVGPGKNSPERMHGAYVDDDEVNRICDAWRERGRPDYIDLSDSYTFEGEGSSDSSNASADELYEAAAAFIVETRKPSISAVQRKFSIGYNRAARLLEQMEERGLVSSMDHSGKRQLLL